MRPWSFCLCSLLSSVLVGCPLAVDDPYVVRDGDAGTGGSAGAATGPCSDGKQSAGETDVDCGGLTCAPCGLGKGCSKDADCMSGNCSSDVCQPP